MHVQADVAAVHHLRLSGVQPGTDAQLGARGPRVARGRALQVDRRPYGVHGAREREKEGVALRVDLAAAPAGARLAQQPRVVGQQLAVRAPQPRRWPVELSMSVNSSDTVPCGSGSSPPVAPRATASDMRPRYHGSVVLYRRRTGALVRPSILAASTDDAGTYPAEGDDMLSSTTDRLSRARLRTLAAFAIAILVLAALGAAAALPGQALASPAGTAGAGTPQISAAATPGVVLIDSKFAVTVHLRYRNLNNLSGFRR